MIENLKKQSNRILEKPIMGIVKLLMNVRMYILLTAFVIAMQLLQISENTE